MKLNVKETILYILNNKYYYYLLLMLSIIFSSIISYENISFDLYFNESYVEYSKFFKTLDFSVFPNNSRTFPLWGYGIFHLLGSNKLMFLIIQQITTFLVLVFIDRQLLNLRIINRIEYFRFLIILSFPWFLFHTQMWPKSISSNLFILGVFLLFKYLKTKEIKFLVISSIVFGLVANFRSDYNYLYLVFFVIIILNSPSGTKEFLKKMLFPAIILMLLLPWTLFTYKQTNKPLLSSTNTGHVLFIGLGQLPDNSWGITPRDDDKVMDSLLKNKFISNYKSYNYKEGIYLKTKFKELIKENPKQWFEKCLYALRIFILDPFYVGNVGNYQHNKFNNINEIRELEYLVYKFEFKNAIALLKKTEWKLSGKEIFQFLFTFFVKAQGLLLIFSFFVGLGLCLHKFGMRLFEEKIIFMLFITIIYQISIAILAFHMPVYNTTVYMFYLLLTYLFFQKYLSIKQ